MNLLSKSLWVAGFALNAAVNATEPAPTPDFLTNPAVVAAIRSAFVQTANGRFGIEAGFRIDGSPQQYRIVAAPFTSQARRQTIGIVPDITLAIFHVHTVKGDPAPSREDRAVADKYRLKVYSIHTNGLYEYDPFTGKTTRLREGAKWMDPAQN